MKNKIIALGTFLLSFYCIHCIGQSRTIDKIEVIFRVSDFQGNPYPKLHFEIYHHEKNQAIARMETNHDGSFTLLLSDPTVIRVSILKTDTLAFLDPFSSIMSIDTQSIQSKWIVLGPASGVEFRKSFLEKFNTTYSDIQQLSSLKGDIGDLKSLIKELELSEEILDSIYFSGVRQKELEFLIIQQRNQARALMLVPKFRGLYEIFISRAQDLRKAFLQYGSKSFYRPDIIVDNLNPEIRSYNDSYEEFLIQKEEILITTNKLYDTETHLIVRQFIEVETLQNFHREMAAYKDITKHLNDYNKKLKGRLPRKLIKVKLDEFISRLTGEINYLSSRKSEVATLLES